MYFARSENSNGKKETIQHHLLRTSELSSSYCNDFGCPLEGKVEGLLHDFGKYSIKFQEVLNGKRAGINHAAAGALVLLQKYGSLKHYESQPAYPIAICIFAHHSSLESDIIPLLKESILSSNVCYDTQSGKELAIIGKTEYFESWKIFSSEIDLPQTSLKSEKYDYCTNPNIAFMLYVRMLFSALVDADYSASAEHFDKNYLIKHTGNALNSELIFKKLLDYENSLKEKSAANFKINNIRNRLYNDCIEAAKMPSGLFTLTAPTGTGKTLSLFAFALQHALIKNKKRIIIVLPYLAIIKQNADIYKSLTEDLLEDHSQSNLDEEACWYAERWSAPVIITTSVKFFESLFACKPTDCRKIHNIANSIIVFDEAQSIPPHLVGTTLDSVNALCKRYNCSIVFSTATQPSFNYRKDIEWKPREIVKEPKKMFFDTRRVMVEWNIKSHTSFPDLAKQMAKLTNCCAIVNMRAHARDLFLQLKHLCNDIDSIFLLSTDLCVKHRQDLLSVINNRLKNHLPCRLVSTQCIEAGVDLDFEVVFRALAPLESIIQAAGRCNRNWCKPLGKVIVFVPDYKGNLYPDKFYETAANKVKLLLSRHQIDICNLKHIDEYYQLLYKDCPSDDEKLLNAISSINFDETNKRYKLIDSSGVNIIVPYSKAMPLFNEIKSDALNNGLTPKLIQKAHSITVNSYDYKNVSQFCEMLPFRSIAGHYQNEDSNWYLLDIVSAYEEQTGLNFDTGFSGII